MQVFYTVRPGDGLFAIAQRWHIPLVSLIAANNLVPPYSIYPGQQLSMPPGVMTGVPFYVVRPGDTLYNIARRYNVILNGQVRPDLIIEANEGLTPMIIPGMMLAIPYPPPGGTGRIAVVLFDDLNYYLQLYNPATGQVSTVVQDVVDRTSKLFWSPDSNQIAAVADSGVISVIDINTKNVARIDQTSLPTFVDWSPDSKKLVYSNGNVIRIYDVTAHTFSTINRAQATYVHFFPSGTELFYEARDRLGFSQLYRSNMDGTGEKRITNNSSFPLNDVRLSPNGKYALYTSPGASISEIYTVELATGRIHKIPGGPEAKNYYPAFSPDSNRIAYSSTQFINGRYFSLIRNSGILGEGDSTLAISSCYATPVTWSPDSQKIAYLSGCREEALPVEVWSIDIRKPVPINALSGFIFFNLAWSPGPVSIPFL